VHWVLGIVVSFSHTWGETETTGRQYGCWERLWAAGCLSITVVPVVREQLGAPISLVKSHRVFDIWDFCRSSFLPHIKLDMIISYGHMIDGIVLHQHMEVFTGLLARIPIDKGSPIVLLFSLRIGYRRKVHRRFRSFSSSSFIVKIVHEFDSNSFAKN
jgi:hypothetical protein